MKTVFITRLIPEVGIKMLRDKGYTVDVNLNESIPTQDEIIKMASCKVYDAIITLLTDKIDTRVFEALPSVKMYANFAVGFDNIDVAEATKRGIVVTNTPTKFSAVAVAEHTIGLMLALSRRIIEGDKFMREGKYIGWSPMNLIGQQLSGKTLGIVGSGHIGTKVAVFAKAIGMNITYTDIIRNEDLEKTCGAKYFTTLKEMLPIVDVLSLHVPLMDSTKHLINREAMKMMKTNALLINTSRGPVVDEEALVEALKDRVIAGAGLDVFEFEPECAEELMSLPNVVLTPHIASASVEARNEMSQVAAANVIAFFEEKEILNDVKS